MNLGENFQPKEKEESNKAITVGEKWILARLNHAIKETNLGMKTFDFFKATATSFDFWWYELCDYFLEMIKPLIYSEDKSDSANEIRASVRETLYTCLDNGLRLLHPFMPYVSEELWQRLPKRKSAANIESIMIAPFPQQDSNKENSTIENEMKNAIEIIKGMRKIRNNFRLTIQRPKTIINFKDANTKSRLEKDYVLIIKTLGQASEIQFELNLKETPTGCSIEIISDSLQVYTILKGEVDLQGEIGKLEKNILKIQLAIDAILKQKENPNYPKVPEKVRLENDRKLEGFKEEIIQTNKGIESLKAILK